MLKGLLFFIVTGLSVSFCMPVLAAPAGGTHPVLDGSLLALAFENEYVVERDIKASDISSGKIKHSDAFYGKLTCRITDSFFAYGKAGIVKLRTKIETTAANSIEEDYDIGVYTGGGIKLAYEVVPDWRVAVDNQFNYYRCSLGSVDYNGTSTSEVSGHISAWEYQLTGILSYTIDYQSIAHSAINERAWLIPYAGVAYSHLKMDADAQATISGSSIGMPGDRENDDSFGVICGLDYTNPLLPGFVFNVEGKFVDGISISGGVNYSF